MRASLVALLAAIASVAIAMPAMFILAPLVYGGEIPTHSFVRFTTASLLALVVGVFALVRRKAKTPGTFSYRFAEALAPKWPSAPIQRVFLLVACAGLAVSIGTVLVFHSDGNSNFAEKIVFDPPWYYKRYFYAFWGGAIPFVVGCLGAFYYEASFGRLVRWVEGG